MDRLRHGLQRLELHFLQDELDEAEHTIDRGFKFFKQLQVQYKELQSQHKELQSQHKQLQSQHKHLPAPPKASGVKELIKKASCVFEAS